MCLAVSFGRPVVVPFAAVLAPDAPADSTVDASFVSRQHGGIEVDASHFVDGNFHGAGSSVMLCFGRRSLFVPQPFPNRPDDDSRR
jgi:hypothetical protein